MAVICVYDNRLKPNMFIRNIVGDKTFGDVILKRKSIREKFYDFAQGQKCIDEVLEINDSRDVEGLLSKVRTLESETHILHLFSHAAVGDEKQAEILFQKCIYIQDSYLWLKEDTPLLFMMDTTVHYCDFMDKYADDLYTAVCYHKNDFRFKAFQTDAFCDLSNHSCFLRYISGGFDARFFNSVSGNEYVVKKSSRDKRKIKAEFEYWNLLPDYMKSWFVMPYNYQESREEASYDMERYQMTDLAIRWVHGAISLEEFGYLLKRVFYFISSRERKEVSKEEYLKLEKTLYVDKLVERMEQLKSLPAYLLFQNFLHYGCQYTSLEEIMEMYLSLYERISSQWKRECISVIGHGDLCFSNMLYSKDTDLLKLIDPKGALIKEEMWTNPYYDIAKLSHSVCGRYDFFNSGLHQISLDQTMRFHAAIEFDNRLYKQMFRNCVEQHGFYYPAVRLYECSLFLSMLPLHIDHPQKVFGFILNAVDIMKEVEECLKE